MKIPQIHICENQNKNLEDKANAEPEDKKDTTIIGSVAVEKGMIILLFFHVGNMICMICVMSKITSVQRTLAHLTVIQSRRLKLWGSVSVSVFSSADCPSSTIEKLMYIKYLLLLF